MARKRTVPLLGISLLAAAAAVAIAQSATAGGLQAYAPQGQSATRRR